MTHSISDSTQSVLVTGATGFIGSHLIPLLLEQHWLVKVALRHPEQAKLPSEVIPISVGNIDRRTDWSCALQGCNAVVHLAARAHVLREMALDPEKEFFDTNTWGTANLVQQAIASGVEHFVSISSIGAMATQCNLPLSETSPCTPDTPYGRSKLAAEKALIEKATASEMTWTILRPPLVYGAGNPGNLERLIRLVRSRLPLPLGGINNRRSLIYVGNLIDAIATCLVHPQAKNQIFLLSDRQPLSTPEIIRQIARSLELSVLLLPVPPLWLKWAGLGGNLLERLLDRPLPLNRDTVERLLGSLVIDSTYIRETLDWSPPYGTEQGFQNTFSPRNH